jgi:hypothetical protein
MQRREAKSGRERPQVSPETERRNDTGENPHRNGLSGVGVGICGFVGLDGGVRSQIRTRLPVIWPISGSFSKKTAIRPTGMSKSAAARAFLEYRDNSISGKNREHAFQSTASGQPNWDPPKIRRQDCDRRAPQRPWDVRWLAKPGILVAIWR